MRTLNVAITVCLSAIIIMTLAVTGCAPAKPKELKEYIFPTFVDASGVYAELYTTTVLPATRAIVDYWNANIGTKLGIKMAVKVYDTRYDFSEAARLYDKCVIDDNPIAINSLVSPNSLANLEKFAKNKTPAVQWFGYGAMHKADAWLFLPGNAYAPMDASFFDWLANKEWKKATKPKITFATFSGTYGKDLHGILDPYLQKHPKLEYLGVKWHDAKATDLTGYVREIMAENPDFIFLSSTSVTLPAFYSAIKELGYRPKVTIVHPCYQGLDVVSKPLGFATIEGDYGVATVDAAPGTTVHKAFTEYAEKYYKGAMWGSTTLQYAAGTCLLLAAVEKAAAKVGPNNLTGQAIFDAINGQEFTGKELYGAVDKIKLDPKDRLSGCSTIYAYKVVGGVEKKVDTYPMVNGELRPWVK